MPNKYIIVLTMTFDAYYYSSGTFNQPPSPAPFSHQCSSMFEPQFEPPSRSVRNWIFLFLSTSIRTLGDTAIISIEINGDWQILWVWPIYTFKCIFFSHPTLMVFARLRVREYFNEHYTLYREKIKRTNGILLEQRTVLHINCTIFVLSLSLSISHVSCYIYLHAAFVRCIIYKDRKVFDEKKHVPSVMSTLCLP